MAKGAALAFLALLGVGASLYVSPGFEGALGAALALTALAIAAIDAREHIIPDGLALLAFALGLGSLAAIYGRDALPPIVDALTRAATMAALFWAFRAAYGAFRGREGSTRPTKTAFRDVHGSLTLVLCVGTELVACRRSKSSRRARSDGIGRGAKSGAWSRLWKTPAPMSPSWLAPRA